MNALQEGPMRSFAACALILATACAHATTGVAEPRAPSFVEVPPSAWVFQARDWSGCIKFCGLHRPGELPGLVALVLRNGKWSTSWRSARRDVERHEPMRRGHYLPHRFDVEGHHQRGCNDALRRRPLPLDRSVSRFLPEFKDPKIAIRAKDAHGRRR